MNISDWLREELKTFINEFITNSLITNAIVSIIMIFYWILLATITIKVVRFLIMRTKRFKKKIDENETKEQLTVKRLINNVIRALYIFWIIVMILKELGLDIMPLLAGAGVLAFAVGFGAQEVIKDFISGFYLILEHTYRIGDAVRINNIEGVITDIGLRKTKIVTWKNEVITINNGDVRMVTNLSLNNSVAIILTKMDRAFDTSILFSDSFNNFLSEFAESNENIVSLNQGVFITDISDGIVFRVTFETVTRKQFLVETSFRKELVSYFKDNNIDMGIIIFNKNES